ncbi:MAG: hypothetical protein HC856_02000 [Pseudanabaena sp. RU_4_16]|nr:hypothetical protein [Pseudanabaena sp. RU_4_16]
MQLWGICVHIQLAQMLLYLYQFQLRISATRAIAPHIFKLKISSAVSINSGKIVTTQAGEQGRKGC